MADTQMIGKVFKKIHVADTVTFAIRNIPTVHQTTLEMFLELVNVSGTFGTITSDQLIGRIRQMLKYIPNTNEHSLYVLVDLLELDATAIPEIRVPARVPVAAHQEETVDRQPVTNGAAR